MVHSPSHRIWLRLPYPNNTLSEYYFSRVKSLIIRPSPRPWCSSAGIAPSSVLSNFMASVCSVPKAGLGGWGAEHTQLGTDMSFTIYRRHLDAPEVENSRCKTFLDLWFLIKDLIMSFDIFHSKISPVVSFLNQVNTPCNPTSSDQLSAESLSLLHKHMYFEMMMYVCIRCTFLEVIADWRKQTSAPQNFEKGCLFFLVWFELA